MQPDHTSEACTKIRQKLTQLSMVQSECTIYRVYEHLREINNKAYEPEVIAIGPYHRGKGKMMEDHKLRYFHSLLERKKENLENYVSVIGPLESEARRCYAEPFSLTATEFIEMLVLDGCFIIDLVRKYNRIHLREKNDLIFHMNWIMNSLKRDLVLFENQIPFFILCKLFDLIEVPNQHDRLVHLLLNFFHGFYPGKLNEEGEEGVSESRLEIDGYSEKLKKVDSSKSPQYTGKLNKGGPSKRPIEMKHLLDLIHSNWLPSNLGEDANDKKARWRFIKNATGLREANVKFKMSRAVSLFEIQFKNGTMLLPPLTIEDRTESLFRNLIAYEQYFHDTQTSFVMGYVKFLDSLIDSSKDVEILSRCGIIDNWLGEDEAVANIFNKLTDSVCGPGNHFIYAEIFDNVNKHCNKRRNRWMAKLRRNYLNSPWAVLSILGAVVVILLTVIQTVTSILQVTSK